jgi:hypothetical protein
MSMRDQIAKAVHRAMSAVGPDYDHPTISEVPIRTADAILEALPSMIAPLVWVQTWGGEYEDIPGWDARRGHYRAHICFAGHSPRINNHADVDLETLDKKKAQENVKYRSAIMAAFTGENR